VEQFLSGIINGALVVALVFLILRRQDKRMDGQDVLIGDTMKKLDNQPSREYCALQHATVEKKFQKGDERFEKLEGKIDQLHTTVTNVDTNVALLLDRDARSRSDD
jgi:hypothetical protein